MTKTFRNFLLVGGIAAVANWGSRFAFQRVMDLNWAVVCAYLIGMTTAYVLSRIFVFEASGRKVADEAARFTFVNMFALGIVWIVTVGLARWAFPAIGFHWHAEAVAHGIGVLSPAVTSYLGHRHFTFAKPAAKAEVSAGAPSSSPVGEAPLAVDMDGTLLKTDTLVEGIVASLFSRPLKVIAALPLLARRRAAFKARIADIAPLNVELLPVREALLQFLAGENDKGRPLYLVTAADHSDRGAESRPASTCSRRCMAAPATSISRARASLNISSSYSLAASPMPATTRRIWSSGARPTAW